MAYAGVDLRERFPAAAVGDEPGRQLDEESKRSDEKATRNGWVFVFGDFRELLSREAGPSPISTALQTCAVRAGAESEARIFETRRP